MQALFAYPSWKVVLSFMYFRPRLCPDTTCVSVSALSRIAPMIKFATVYVRVILRESADIRCCIIVQRRTWQDVEEAKYYLHFHGKSNPRPDTFRRRFRPRAWHQSSLPGSLVDSPKRAQVVNYQVISASSKHDKLQPDCPCPVEADEHPTLTLLLLSGSS